MIQTGVTLDHQFEACLTMGLVYIQYEESIESAIEALEAVL